MQQRSPAGLKPEFLWFIVDVLTPNPRDLPANGKKLYETVLRITLREAEIIKKWK